jgi:hypothetical protein
MSMRAAVRRQSLVVGFWSRMQIVLLKMTGMALGRLFLTRD